MGTAEYISTQANGPQLEQQVYRVYPPMRTPNHDHNADNVCETDYVLVSATASTIPPETYIFACNERGQVANWSELEGSFKGEMDIEKALYRAGYKIKA